MSGKNFDEEKFSSGKIFVGENFLSGKIFVTRQKFRQFSPTKFSPIRYLDQPVNTIKFDFQAFENPWLVDFFKTPGFN